MFKVLDSWKKIVFMNRNISVCRSLQKDEKTPKRKVKETVELVTLVDQNDKILGLKPKTESEKLAKKLNLTLERVTDTKYGKMYPAYKMFSQADLLQQEKKTSTAKTMKKIAINSRISSNDLVVKINIVKNWLSKGNCEVHVAILKNDGVESTMKNVLAEIQEKLKEESRMLNIRHKEDAIKFILIPPKQPINKTEKPGENS